jgi:integrase/recombinase XerD
LVTISKINHKGSTRILLCFLQDAQTLDCIKSLSQVAYTKTHKGWHLPYSKEAWTAFKALGLKYDVIESNGETKIFQKPNNLIPSNTPLHDGIALHHPKQIDQPGTASSPIESDIASIATHPVAPSVHPSYGDSKGTDIHLVKGGRSIQLSGTNFYISIYYNEDDIKFLKGLKGYWQSKIKKWIVKANSDTLESLQRKYVFWDHPSYDKIKALILQIECPYLVTLYRTPELAEIVIVEVTGYKAKTHIIKSTTERCYQKDGKKWTIPNDQVIIDILIAEYTKDGATVINRLPQEGFDYHKKDESYGQFKTRYLQKTETGLKPIAERYIDTLIAFKRSKKTMTTYLGPFIKFVKQVGIDTIENLSGKDIDKYMSMISSQKVSDGLLHNTYNAILFYYRDVLRKNEKVIIEAKRPKKDNSLPIILSLGEVDRILRALDNLKHTTILYTFYSSGIRLGEILNLRVEDMWWERNQIFIHKGKGNKDRVVPFSGILKELLKLYFDTYKPIYWLFEGQDKKLPYSDRSIQKVVKNAVKKAAINKKATAHTMRHCFATHLLDGGTDVRYIQELLGHSDIKTTLIYTHVTNHQISKIESPLDKLMKNRNENDKNG